MVRFREIERLRGLAILLAVFNHEPLRRLVPWYTGVIGVHLFFVISGFVITLSLLRLKDENARPLATFFTRRFFRLFPMAGLSIGLALVCSLFLNRSQLWSPVALIEQQAVAALTLTYNYRHFDLGWDLIYFWSLNVEEHFYLVLPLVLVVGTRKWRWSFGHLLTGLAGAWAVASIVRILSAPDSYQVVAFWKNHFSTHAQLDVLLAGVLLGLSHHIGLFERPSASRELRVALTAVAAVATAGLIFVHKLFGWESQLGWSVVELTSVILVWLASFRRGYVLRFPLVSEALEFLGARAYVIYLVHMASWRVVAELLSRAPGAEQALGTWGVDLSYAALVLIFSEACYRCVEQPLIAAGRRLTRPQAQTPAKPQARAA